MLSSADCSPRTLWCWLPLTDRTSAAWFVQFKMTLHYHTQIFSIVLYMATESFYVRTMLACSSLYTICHAASFSSNILTIVLWRPFLCDTQACCNARSQKRKPSSVVSTHLTTESYHWIKLLSMYRQFVELWTEEYPFHLYEIHLLARLLIQILHLFHISTCFFFLEPTLEIWFYWLYSMFAYWVQLSSLHVISLGLFTLFPTYTVEA